MAQWLWLRVLAAFPEDPTSIPSSKGSNVLKLELLCLWARAPVHMCTHTDPRIYMRKKSLGNFSKASSPTSDQLIPGSIF